MKTKIAILTDSSSSIYTINHGYENVFMIDIPCFLGDETFTNFAINGNQPFYEALTKFKGVPKTSQPSIGETVIMYERIRALGYSDIIYLPISRELSGTYDNAYIAKNMVEGINITIIDTLTTVSILTGMVFSAAKLALAGASVNEIVSKIDSIKANWSYYLTVDDLTSLVKNGRLSNAKKFIANILRIKPLIKFSQDGKLIAIQNVRTYKGAMKEIVNKVVKEVDPLKGVVHISYANNEEDFKFIEALVREALPNTPIEVYQLPATISAHLGLAAIGVGYINY